MRITTTILIFLLVIPICGILLQIFLSKRESRFPGLVLPGITVLFSLIAVLGIMAYDSLGRTIVTVISVLFFYNIPTLVLLAIYFACRAKRKPKDEIEKMNIQDLE